MSIFVTTIKKGISKAKAIPRCSLVILVRPLFAPTTIKVYSGTIPTIPTMVVFRYFSCPQRSIKFTIFFARGTISVQYLFFLCTNHSAKICCLCSSKTMISWAMDEVLPLSDSWAKLNTFSLELPLPLSSMPFVSTPTRVLFPESTFPTTQILM